MKNNNTWVINRFGMVNFWYYDSQDYMFQDGRLLLRGANGSGKSVTMQLFIPLLLDGNKSPHRLDPFGGKDRRLENYLLEEDSPDDERTGYLFIEFVKGAQKLAIGMGARARKKQGVDSWYFILGGGMVIGDNFRLVKDGACLTKSELRTQAGSAGQVFDSQKEYMQAVNRAVFGFSSPGEYSDMIDLLVQLRSPKLSKDYKPTVIHEILNDSLPPLTEEDLRPLSEAIENMDDQKDKLDAIEASKNAADKIAVAFDHYNRLLAAEKARHCASCLKRQSQLARERDDLTAEMHSHSDAILTGQRAIDALEQERAQCERTRAELLSTHADALSLKERLTALEEDIADTDTRVDKKRESLEAKKRQLLKCEKDLKVVRDESEMLQDLLEDLVNDLRQYANDCAFEDHGHFQSEFKPESGYDFILAKDAVKRYRGILRQGRRQIEALAGRKAERDALQEKLDSLGVNRDKLAEDFEREETQLAESLGLLADAARDWARECRVFPVEETLASELRQQCENFVYSQYPLGLRALLQQPYMSAVQAQGELAGALLSERKALEEHKRGLEQEILDLQNLPEVEPERDAETLANRRRLQELGIPFTPFYKMLRFKDDLEDRQRDNIEEALYRMGVLDALVIPDKHKGDVLRLDGGVCDKYIFYNNNVKPNIRDILEIDASINADTEYGQSMEAMVRGAFGAIGYGFGQDAAATYIESSGQYRIGALAGNTSGSYVSRYIGEAARERERCRLMEEIHGKLTAVDAELAALNARAAALEADREALRAEYARFPDETGVNETARVLAELDFKLDEIKKEVERQRALLTPVLSAINTLQIEVVKLREFTSLAATVEVFSEAEEGMENYSHTLTEAEIEHHRLIAALEKEADLKLQLEELEVNREELDYEMSQLERTLRRLRAEEGALNEKLRLSGYEEVQAKIEYCVARGAELNAARDQLLGAVSASRAQAERLAADLEAKAEALRDAETRATAVRRALTEELSLGYALDGEEGAPDLSGASSLERLAGRLESVNPFPNKDSAEMNTEVQSRMVQNSQFLADYNLVMVELFANEPLLPFKHKRIDILCRVDGKKVPFAGLSARLAEAIEEQRLLIRENDRRLFEEVLGNNIAKLISRKIYECENWVRRINSLMERMDTSSGLALSLRWNGRRADTEDEMNTRELVELLKKDAAIRRDEDYDKIRDHFHSKIEQARKKIADKDSLETMHDAMRGILDYRKWFEFQLLYVKTGERQRELTNRVFSQFSGGEKAMSMYVPLFSAVVAKYGAAADDAPRLISLDEAFAGVDDKNIKDMFKLMVEFNFNFVINSQALWGDYETVPSLSIYELHRPNNSKFITTIQYIWNGLKRMLVTDNGGDSEQSA